MESYDRQPGLVDRSAQMLALVICMASAFLMGMLVMGIIWWRW